MYTNLDTDEVNHNSCVLQNISAFKLSIIMS